MIQFANKNSKNEIRQMWKVCFTDSEEFMDIYFSEKYQNENTLIFFEQNCAVASLQLLPYFFSFCGVEIPVSYISGACTLPEYRKKGYMGKLINKSLEIINQRCVPVVLLIPAEDYLYSYYEKFGFETVFDLGEDSDFLKGILNEAITNFDSAYLRFNSFFRSKDFCIQKSETDFKTIVKDASISNLAPKFNLPGMARIIDIEFLLNIFASKHLETHFSIELTDNILPFNNATYSIENGKCIKNAKKTDNCFKTDIKTLCRLLFGFHLEEIPNKELSKIFISHHPVLNLMLE